MLYMFHSLSHSHITGAPNSSGRSQVSGCLPIDRKAGSWSSEKVLRTLLCEDVVGDGSADAAA